MVDNFFLSLVNIRVTLSLFKYRQDTAPTTTNPPTRYKVYSLSATWCACACASRSKRLSSFRCLEIAPSLFPAATLLGSFTLASATIIGSVIVLFIYYLGFFLLELLMRCLQTTFK